MPRVARVKSNSGIYHIMLRGANKQEIFHDDYDRNIFLNILEKYKIQSDMSIYAWCLMNNHVHLLVKEGSENISVTMKRIGVSYVWHYNWKYHTNGHLFQDRFRSEIVETYPYLLRVTRYIHQNPVKAGIVKRVDDWKWSSCRGYYGKSLVSENLLDQEYILSHFSVNPSVAKERFKEFNEMPDNDSYLEDKDTWRRMTDKEAGLKIKNSLGSIEIAQVKSLPKTERTRVLRKIKEINGLSLRQAARILGVSPSLINRA
ncbi:REP element-mobilizing transposase RayT [Bacillus oleivorans]|uniref:REP element-mobilizing transposase RayT n=1 Tax=Bacillus oleivorans TaxID=1448271 RepID=A0A285CJI7_9BACI|nr:REP element-mobilizing transposase RayT [Bacillus oleivorans]